MANTVLDVGKTEVNKLDRTLPPHGTFSLVGDRQETGKQIRKLPPDGCAGEDGVMCGRATAGCRAPEGGFGQCHQ